MGVVTNDRRGQVPVISVMLAVPDAGAAAAWYAEALGATELWNLGSVIGLDVAGAPLFLGEPAGNGWSHPMAAGTRTVRIEVFVDDPDAFVARAVAAGADGSRDPIRVHEAPWGTHRQGAFLDPFGHLWLVGDRTPLLPYPRPGVVADAPDHDELVRRLTGRYAACLPAEWTLSPAGPAEVHVATGTGAASGDLFVYGPAELFAASGGLDPQRLLRPGMAYVFAGVFPAGAADAIGPVAGGYAAQVETVVTPTEDVVFGASAPVPDGVLAAFVAAIIG
jgi:PhnB protein